MSRVSMLALGVGAYLAFAVVSFPASIAHRWFAPDALALAGIEGTVWRGAADYGGYDSLAFAGLRWQLHPLSLLTGRLGLSIEARLPDGFVRTELTITGGSLSLREFAGTTSLASLDDVMPVPGLQGNLSLTLDSLELVDGWPMTASGTMRVANLSSPPLIPVPGVTRVALGNFSARLTMTDETGVAAIVTDDGGPLELEGRVDLAGDRSYRLTSRIRARADAAPVLVEGLQWLARPDAEGWHAIERRGNL